MRAKYAVVLLTLLLGAIVLSATASQQTNARPGLDPNTMLAVSQAAIGNTLADYRFVDGQGKPVALVGLRGRPVLISLIYTSCWHSCSILTKQLAKVVGIAREALGADSFTVLSIGFDTLNDTPARMRSYARAQGIAEPDWRFLSADMVTIERLSRDLGFSYAPSANGFDHTAQVTLVDQQGQVYRQIYGEYLPAPALVEPLKQLVFGRSAAANTLSGWIDGVRLLCTVYDPNSGRYTFDYSIFIAAFVGIVCLGAVAVFLIRAWRDSDTA